MDRVADDVWRLQLAPRAAVNAYLIGDVLLDAGTPGMGRRVPDVVAGRTIAAHAITHAHPDHVGGSRYVVEQLRLPFWAPARDADACEAGRAVAAPGPLHRLFERGSGFPAVRVDRRLVEGDVAGGFVVLDAPGHSPGQVVFWREADRVLVCGDVWFGMRFLPPRGGLRAPFAAATVDPEQNRRSMRRLADLRPDVVCFGHGPVLYGAAPVLRRFVDAL